MYNKLVVIFFVVLSLVFIAGCQQEEENDNEIKEYYIELEAEPSEGGETSGEGKFEIGREITIEAKPTDNYTFTGWQEEGEIIATDKSYSFTVREDRHLIAVFEEIDTEVYLYFGNREAIETGNPGPHGYVTPIAWEIDPDEDTEAILLATINKLIEGPTPEMKEEKGLSPVVHQSLRLLDVTIEERIATINVCREMFGEEWPGGSLAGTVFIQSMVYTATQFDEVDQVIVLVEEEYWDDSHRIWEEPKSPPVLLEAYRSELSETMEEWINYSRDLWLAQDREDQGFTYLLVTYGKKSSGGYGVDITDATKEENQLTITVEFTDPAEGQPVTPAVTFPYDLKKIPATDLPVEFVAEGDRGYVPELQNLDWLPPLVAGNEDIRILSPEPKATVSRNFIFEGIELVYEGTVLYRIMDHEGEGVENGIIPGGHGHHWGHLKKELTVPEAIESGDKFMLEIYSESPVDGQPENQVELELFLE